jgi:predicted DsbA family dithiol-disulfide isomerase
MPAKACGAGLDEFATTRERIAQLRNECQAVRDRVCVELGVDNEACLALTQDLPSIPPGHCGALKRDADRLVVALRERQEALQPLSDALWGELVAGDAPGFGAPDAAVVLVEFSDFQCPYCAEAARTVKQVKERYATGVRFVFRNFPLPSHPDAFRAAQAAVAAHEQGKFWGLHDQMFDNQQALGAAALSGHAKSAGLDVAAFEKASQSDVARARVQTDLALGERVNVNGTPTLFLNKRRVENPLDFDALSSAIDEVLASAPSGPASAPAALPAPASPAAPPAAKAK